MISDPNEYIEAYFTGQLNEDEKKQFEQQCVQDEAFARQVAIFITTTEGIRQTLLQQKKREWGGGGTDRKSSITPPVKRITLRYWIPYAAAACLLLAVAIYFFSPSETPQERADNYIAKHFTQLSQTMNASQDSLQRGIAAYNNKDYQKALQFFEDVYRSNPQHGVAKKYIGLVYLMNKDYDQALQHFDELANHQDLYRNPGLFLKAVTLLKRNEQGDPANAKQLLEQVVKQKAEGSREAQRWLQQW